MIWVMSVNAAIAVAVLSLTSGGIGAQDPTQPSPADCGFVQQVAADNLAMGAEAKLVLTRAQRDDLREFARYMIDEHDKVNTQLGQAAAAARIDLPSAPSEADQREIEQLSALSGTAFEQRYVRDLVIIYKNEVALLETERNTVNYPALQTFVIQALPAPQGHRRTIKQIAGAPGGDELPAAQ